MAETYDTSVFLKYPTPFIPNTSQGFVETVRLFCNTQHVAFYGFGIADGLLSQMEGFFEYLEKILPNLFQRYGTDRGSLSFFKIGFCMPVKEIYAEFLIYSGRSVGETIVMTLQKGPAPVGFNTYHFEERVKEFAPYYQRSLMLSMGNVLPLFRDYLHNETGRYPFIRDPYFQLGVEAARLFFKKTIEEM